MPCRVRLFVARTVFSYLASKRTYCVSDFPVRERNALTLPNSSAISMLLANLPYHIEKTLLQETFMKKTICLLLSLFLSAGAASLAGCSEDGIKIALPNDATNEARALLLLEDLGWITLKEGAGISATPRDVEENPYGIEFVEMEAAQIPRALPDVDYAVINSNYALDAGINPISDSLAIEEADGNPYSNILAVKSGNENTPAIRALVAALSSRRVADFIEETYGGAVISSVAEPGDGYDAALDYAALAGTSVSVAA